MVSKVQRNMGCNGNSPVEHRLGMLRSRQCFGKLALDGFSEWIDMALRYKKHGILPLGQNLNDIPAKVVYLLKFIDNVFSEKLKED